MMTRHSILGNVYITPGVHHFASQHLCWWLVDAIASHTLVDAVQNESISFWSMFRDKNGSSATLLGSDGGKGDDPPVTLVRQTFLWVDLTDEELPAKFFMQRSEDDTGRITFTIMLPEEY